jgi:hypothetical protein
MTTQDDKQPTNSPDITAVLPTLTEVVDLNASSIRVEDVVEEVLKELQQHMDGVLEYRLRETLTPILNRVTDTLIRETRLEWTKTLNDLVKRAVEQSLRRLQSTD